MLSLAVFTRAIEFLSTLSLRRATDCFCRFSCHIRISIHALLAESDLVSMLNRPDGKISIHALLAESDAWNRFTQRRDFISIHALLAESDTEGSICFDSSELFLSTLSLRRATSREKQMHPER